MADTEPHGPGPEAQRYLDVDQAAASHELVKRVEQIYAKLLADASKRGLSEAETEAVLVDGWNTGAIPRVVDGMHMRGSGYELVVLGGEVPPDVFSRFHKDDDYGLIMPGDYYPNGSLTFVYPTGVATESDPNDQSAFYVQILKLPQIARDPRFPREQVAADLATVEALMGPAQ